jgi:hypothetical protein
MLTDTNPLKGLRLPNTFSLAPRHTAQVAGHLLKALYADVLQEEQPEALRSLVRQLEVRERAIEDGTHSRI